MERRINLNRFYLKRRIVNRKQLEVNVNSFVTKYIINVIIKLYEKHFTIKKLAKIKGDIYFSFINKNWKCLYLFSVFFYINSGKTGAYSEPLGLGPIFGQTNLLQFKYSKLRGNDILQHVFGRC